MAASSSTNSRARRTFLFQLSDEDKAAPDQPVKFCQRVPQTEKHPDPVTDEDLRSARVAFLNILDGLWRKPQLAVACNTWLSTRMAHALKPQGEAYFKTAPAMVKLIEEDWLATFLLRHTRMTQAVLEQAAVFDPMTPFHILCYGIRSSTHMKLGKLLINKAILANVLE